MIDELIKALTSLLEVDDRAGRSEILTPAIDRVKTMDSEITELSAQLDDLLDSYTKLQDENRRLFLMVNEVPEENSENEHEAPELEDLFNDDGTLKS